MAVGTWTCFPRARPGLGTWRWADTVLVGAPFSGLEGGSLGP